MNKMTVINIQRFSLHDGDGIRTTVFFKGCPLGCIWCHNPESRSFTQDLMYYSERCVGCLSCLYECPLNAIKSMNEKIYIDREICDRCGKCEKVCSHSALEMVGKPYTVMELFKELKKDQIIYDDSGGGVTLSGGECMAQDIDFIKELVKKLQKIGISIAIDTSGYVPKESLETILPYVDMFLYDIKSIDEDKHKKFTDVSIKPILDNLIFLSEKKAKIYLRLPIIGGINDDKEDIIRLINWLKENQIILSKIFLIPYHNTGSSKYERLGMDYQSEKMSVPTNEYMEELKNIFEFNGFTNVKIGG